MTLDQLEAINDSDALCEGCGANPREAEHLEGWFVDSVLVEEQNPRGSAVEHGPGLVRMAIVRCPRCW